MARGWNRLQAQHAGMRARYGSYLTCRSKAEGGWARTPSQHSPGRCVIASGAVDRLDCVLAVSCTGLHSERTGPCEALAWRSTDTCT